jgi:cell division septum initiation protein DivIVA
MILNDDAFAQMVAEEVKNKLSPAQRELLLETQNWDRWKRALEALVRNLESQIENIVADAEADANRYAALGREGKKLAREAASAYGNRQTKIERFLFHVVKRLDQVKTMVETGRPIETNPFETANFYRRAILKHRSLLHEYDMEDTAIDRALWAALDNKWEFDRVTSDTL